MKKILIVILALFVALCSNAQQTKYKKKQIKTKVKVGQIKKTAVKSVDTLSAPKAVFQDLLSFVEKPIFDGKIQNDNNKDDAPYRQVELSPSFPGGTNKLIFYLDSAIRYPPQEFENGKEARVDVEFIINKDGKISDVKIVKSGGKNFDIEAIRVVQNMPNWNAGMQNGKKVNCLETISIVFKIED